MWAGGAMKSKMKRIAALAITALFLIAPSPAPKPGPPQPPMRPAPTPAPPPAQGFQQFQPPLLPWWYPPTRPLCRPGQDPSTALCDKK